MKTIKARHKLVPAIIMLIVAAITMSTASYAWFTMSNRVEVTGVELTVVAPTNILIRERSSTYPNAFSNSVTVSTNPTTGKLSHASSIDGETMFTVENAITMVETDGTLTSTATIVTATTPVAPTTDGFYIDFFFELVNTGSEDVSVGLENLVIAGTTTSAAGTYADGAVRFAILEDGTDSLGVFAKSVETVQAYDTTTTLAAQTTVTSGVDLFDVLGSGVADASSPNPAGMKSITVRVWIEGQDDDCVTANAGSSFSISFDLVVTTP